MGHNIDQLLKASTHVLRLLRVAKSMMTIFIALSLFASAATIYVHLPVNEVDIQTVAFAVAIKPSSLFVLSTCHPLNPPIEASKFHGAVCTTSLRVELEGKGQELGYTSLQGNVVVRRTD